MLFDMRGRRRRMIQVVYGILAVLFLVGFVGFGVGSPGTGGGILDAVGLGGGDSNTGSAQFDDQITRAEQQLKKDPKDEKALLSLARLHYAAGNASAETDPTTGQVTVTDDARIEYQGSISAWERYLKLNPGKPDPGTAAQVFRAYDALAPTETDPAALESELQGAAETAAVVAEDNPSPNTWASAAQYAYLSGDTAKGDAAAAQAKKGASKSELKQLDKLLTQVKAAGTKLQKAIKKAGPGKQALTSPLGGLGESAPSPTGAPGSTAPPAP